MTANPQREVIIRVEDFTAAYDEQVVLERVSFEVYAGEVFAILGGSGCGKSTLLKHMIGLYRPAVGRILIDGDDIAAAVGEKRLAILRKFGVMYQSGALFGSMTLRENVSLPLEEFTDLPPEAIRLIALMKLHRVGLSGAADRMPSTVPSPRRAACSQSRPASKGCPSRGSRVARRSSPYDGDDAAARVVRATGPPRARRDRGGRVHDARSVDR